MRFRVELLSVLWLSAIGLSVPATGCFEDDDDPDAGESDEGRGGKGGKGGSGGEAGSGEACGKAGTGGTGAKGGSCSRAGTGGIGGTPGAAGNGPWPPFGQPENGECGLPLEPRWGFELYEDMDRVSVPKLGGKEIDVMGMVTGAGEGVPDDLGRSGDEADLRHVRVQSAEHTYTIVTYGAPGAGSKLTTGTEVSLTHHDATCDYILCSSDDVFTRLRSAGTDVMLYAPTGGATPEGYSHAFGDELCEGRTHCSAWTGHLLDITSPSGVTLAFAPGEVDELGDYTIYAGIIRQHKAKNNLESARAQCADTRLNTMRQLLFVRFE